ncbi:putative treponemal aqueous protein [Treponema primitia ZAS-2]|uniref:Putative treponemal aqueous protein n=1 Tax=Treponema primitia (strain ATCC BAA-887 / DSM 12427 / ZAS-2) TaxID=545694 RepID=F5YPC4_TREPZ|nr:flagellar hook-length control protein FliK [Treponema primitia]AEF84739.1 putative treponemal aqueous protein [Treponema primitia ZAS-2]
MLAVSSEVSPQTNSVEAPEKGPVKHAKGAKKDALSGFSKILAGLLRKTKAGGENAAESAAEALVSLENASEAVKDAAEKEAKFPGTGDKISAGSKKPTNKDGLSLLTLSSEEGDDTLSPAERVRKAMAAKQEEDGVDTDVPLFAGVALDTDPGQVRIDELFREGLSPGDEQEGEELFLSSVSEGRLKAKASAEELLSRSDAQSDAALNPEKALRLSQGQRQNPETTEKKATAAETRNSRKNRERVSLEVQDQRTGQNGPAPLPGQELKPFGETGPERVSELTVDLKNGGRNREFPEAGHEKTAGQAFEDILARELHQNLNGDIVRQASIMVKDGGEGTIKLSLKPESLGMVKIRLEMVENKITGHIIVESNEALRAFEREMHSLEQAFRDSGFEGASLDMALAQDGGRNSGQGRWNGEPERPLFSPQLVSSSYDSSVESTLVSGGEFFNAAGGPGMIRVNVLV